MKKGLIFIFILLIYSGQIVSSQEYIMEINHSKTNLIIKESFPDGSSFLSLDENSLENHKEGIFIVKKITFKDNFSSSKVILNLAEGFIMGDKQAYPTNYRIQTDGRKITLIWENNLTLEGDNMVLFVDVKGNENSLNYIIWIILILIFLFIFAYLRTFILKNKQNEDYLLESEKQIISLLKKSDRRELWQKQIQTALGISKVKTSRMIRNLESRKLIIKIPFGNTNKIKLK